MAPSSKNPIQFLRQHNAKNGRQILRTVSAPFTGHGNYVSGRTGLAVKRANGLLTALIAWLSLIAQKAWGLAIAIAAVTALIAGLTFVAEQPGRLRWSNAFFEFFDV
jgi:hypothetical protein